MWGLKWGALIWGKVVAVPAVGLWGLLFLGAVLGVVGVRCLQGKRPRTIAGLALALALVVPLSVRAVPFTFSNGTVADATQVNANFAAVTLLTGFNTFSITQTVGAQRDVLAPAFVAPRALTCTVTTELHIPAVAVPVGTSSISTVVRENGAVRFAFGQPAGLATPNGMWKSSAFSTEWISEQTRPFAVASGSSVEFGTRINATGDFASATSLTCTIMWSCQ